jgi:hypothetical protein
MFIVSFNNPYVGQPSTVPFGVVIFLFICPYIFPIPVINALYVLVYAVVDIVFTQVGDVGDVITGVVVVVAVIDPPPVTPVIDEYCNVGNTSVTL